MMGVSDDNLHPSRRSTCRRTRRGSAPIIAALPPLARLTFSLETRKSAIVRRYHWPPPTATVRNLDNLRPPCLPGIARSRGPVRSFSRSGGVRASCAARWCPSALHHWESYSGGLFNEDSARAVPQPSNTECLRVIDRLHTSDLSIDWCGAVLLCSPTKIM